MVGDQEDDAPDAGWTVRLNQVERLDREDDDEGENFFSVEFELSGPGVSGTMSALVTDPASEETVITEALDQLQDGLATYARVVARRNEAERVEPTER